MQAHGDKINSRRGYSVDATGLQGDSWWQRGTMDLAHKVCYLSLA